MRRQYEVELRKAQNEIKNILEQRIIDTSMKQDTFESQIGDLIMRHVDEMKAKEKECERAMARQEIEHMERSRLAKKECEGKIQALREEQCTMVE